MGPDLHFALRQLRRNPAFAATAVLVLGLGVGVATAMFSVLYGVLLRPLPYLHPEQLVSLSFPSNNANAVGMVSLPYVQDWQRQSRSFEQIAYDAPRLATLQTSADTEEILAEGCSWNLFATLGVRPRLGRGFLPDDQTGRHNVAVLSDALWHELFAAQPNIVGRHIQLSHADFTIVGVMPPGFTFPLGDAGLWTPYAPAPGFAGRGDFTLEAIARLRPGVSAAAAQAELSAVQAVIVHAHPEEHDRTQVWVRSYAAGVVAGVRPALLALGGAVALVWLIACFAVAGLVLTRMAARQRELAVRAALGASRRRLARQLLAESLCLGGLASLAGLAIAAGALAALRHLLLQRLPGGMSVTLSAPVLLGLAALTLVSVLAVGSVPALWLPRAAAQASLREGASTASRGQARVREALVVAEIALALLFVASAGLLLRTLFTLRAVPLGFATDNLITTALVMPSGRFDHENMVQVFDQPLLQRLQALPGVRAAALTSVVPLEPGFTMTGRFEFVDRPHLPDSQQPQGDVRFSSPDYAAVLGIPILHGRFFDARRDTPTSPMVLVVNQAFAARFFPGQDAVGQQIALGKKRAATIIGVLANVHERALNMPPAPVMHFSTTQLSPSDGFYPMATAFGDLAVRTRGPAAGAIGEIRAALHAVAPDVAPQGFSTMRQLVADSMGSQILGARLLGLFSLAALVIALAGLYGVLAFAVAQRRRELGIRIALGAQPARILRLVLGHALALLALGLALGLVLALACGRVLAAYLYHVPDHDPATLALAMLLLAAAGLAAAWLPARQAAQVNPVEALHSE